MEQFSSCYFCGDAVDATLDEYPVVPASVDPEAGGRRTIVLCTGCKRKLDPVVEAVVGAVDDAATVDHSDSDGRERGAAGSESDDGDDGAGHESDSTTDIGSSLGDDEDVLRSVGDGTDDETDDAGATEFGRSPETDASDGDGAAPEEENSEEQTYSSGQRAGGRPTGGSGDDGDDEEEDPKRDVTLTRLENTNVMRMMQNREFPVDRDDFVTVASSAYGISPDRCEKVVDLAVKHDLLRDRDGQLHAGPEWS